MRRLATQIARAVGVESPIARGCRDLRSVPPVAPGQRAAAARAVDRVSHIGDVHRCVARPESRLSIASKPTHERGWLLAHRRERLPFGACGALPLRDGGLGRTDRRAMPGDAEWAVHRSRGRDVHGERPANGHLRRRDRDSSICPARLAPDGSAVGFERPRLEAKETLSPGVARRVVEGAGARRVATEIPACTTHPRSCA